LLFWLLGLAVVAIAIWSGVWLFAAQQTGTALQAWVAREKAFGRVWSCPHPRIGGYPAAVSIDCASPRFDGLILGHSYSGTLQRLYVTASVSHPRDIDIAAGSPFVATSKDDKVNFQLSWHDLRVRLSGLPQDLWQADVSGEDIALHGSAGAVGFGGTVHATAVTAAQRATQDGPAIDFDLTLGGASLPLIEQVLGPGAPTDIGAEGSVTKTSFRTSLTPAQNLDLWRTAGGHVDLTTFELTRADTKFAAKGTFTLSDAHRVNGHFETTSSGLEPVLQHYGIDPSLLSFGALLGNLLSGHSSDQPKQGPTVLHLPVEIDDGRLAVGPVRTSFTLGPVY
jgi:hypothetical protein